MGIPHPPATEEARPGGKFGMESGAARGGSRERISASQGGRLGREGGTERGRGPARSRSVGGGGCDTSPLPPPGHGQSHVGKRQHSPGSRRGGEGRAG